jgi:hypothetical protein
MSPASLPESTERSFMPDQIRTPATIDQPKPPFPPQHQSGTGLESRLQPRPRYQAESYKPAGKLDVRRDLLSGG